MQRTMKCAAAMGISMMLAAGMLFGQGMDKPSDNMSKKPVKETKMSSADVNFLKDALQGGMFEVEAGKLAATKATNDRVKEFGRLMEKDHGKADADLRQLAAKKNVTLPEKLGETDQGTYDRLSQMAGDDFTKEYIHLMVQDHGNDISMFQKISENANDPDVKAWARSLLPTLKKHLSQAKEISTSLEKTKKAM